MQPAGWHGSRQAGMAAGRLAWQQAGWNVSRAAWILNQGGMDPEVRRILQGTFSGFGSPCLRPAWNKLYGTVSTLKD